MAGDWIKMRDELFTHPKFLSLCSILIYEQDRSGLIYYTCQPDYLEPGFPCPDNYSVTDEALRAVTESALRDVTMCALLRVWCAVNSHCKVDGLDAVMAPMILSDVDQIARIDGFGDALLSVGWIIKDDGCNSLRFPNFLEFNDPACTRHKPRSNRERQADFRARQRAQKESVTKVTKVTGEKRREEKSKDTPLPPQLDTPAFREAWDRWTKHRSEIKKKLTPTSISQQLKALGEMGLARAVRCIDHTIEKGWTGLREPDDGPHVNGKHSPPDRGFQPPVFLPNAPPMFGPEPMEAAK